MKFWGQRRVDGVGRPKFDFHTGRDGPDAPKMNPRAREVVRARGVDDVLEEGLAADRLPLLFRVSGNLVEAAQRP